jgi:tetratricopeptide (TPR) repeat protein
MARAIAPEAALAARYALDTAPEWQKLLTHLGWWDGFAFICLLVPDPTGAEIAFQALARHFAAPTAGQPARQVQRLTFANPEDLEGLVERLVVGPAEPPGTGALWVEAVVPEQVPGYAAWRQAWFRFAAQLNGHRNPFQRRHTYPVLFVGAPWLQTLLREVAPDLWSIRTLVVELAPAPLPPALAADQAAPADTGWERSGYDPNNALRDAERLRGLPATLEPEREQERQQLLARLLVRAGRGFGDREAWPAAAQSLAEAVGILNQHAPAAAELADALFWHGNNQHAPAAAELADALFWHGNALAQLSRLEEAQAALERARALFEALGGQAGQADTQSREGLARVCNNLGNVYQARGELDQAEAMVRQALALNEALGSKEGMAINYGNLGNVYQARGELDQAEAMVRQALALNEALGSKEGMAINYGNLGGLYQTRGELDQAEAMYRKSLAIEETLGRKGGMASDYCNLGNVYKTRGELDQAEAMYRKSLALNEALGCKAGMASDYGNLGNVYNTRGELDQAEVMYRQALALNEALGRKAGMAANYGNLGNVYQARGELDQAEVMYRKSLALFEAVGARPQIDQAQGLLDALVAGKEPH